MQMLAVGFLKTIVFLLLSLLFKINIQRGWALGFAIGFFSFVVWQIAEHAIQPTQTELCMKMLSLLGERGNCAA